jgi:hypothetical protein
MNRRCDNSIPSDTMIRMKPRVHGKGSPAFTLIECVTILTSVAVLLVCASTALANNRARSDRAVCANNLFRIGSAFRAWATDHGDVYPWLLPAASGGSKYFSQTWGHFQVVSAELRSPAILVCPADSFRASRAASNFNGNQTGSVTPFWTTTDRFALVYPTHQNNSVSYVLSLHASADSRTAILAMDRHLTGWTANQACSFMNQNIANAIGQNPAAAGLVVWTNAIHGANTGNSVLSDGSVRLLSNKSWQQEVINDNGVDGPIAHFLPP